MILHELRAKKGLSQGGLADASGISLRTIQCWECGYRNLSGANIGTLIKLAAALDCKLADLIEDDQLKAELLEVI